MGDKRPGYKDYCSVDSRNCNKGRKCTTYKKEKEENSKREVETRKSF